MKTTTTKNRCRVMYFCLLSTAICLLLLIKPSSGLALSPNVVNLAETQFPRTWVPIGSVKELDPNRPSPIKFLNQKYVTYQDNDANWIVMDDACPHRLAPLSEGRIDREKGLLQCSYHGWEYNSEGCACRIPQMTQEDQESVLSSSSSTLANVPTYPTHVEKNILWMWPWAEDAIIDDDSPAYPARLMANISSDPMTYTRDLPYGWEALVENLIDPAHIPFAHHGLQGNREDAIPINMTMNGDDDANGFSFFWQDRTLGKFRSGIGAFRAPYVIHYDATFKEDGKPFDLNAICIPTEPGWSRGIVLQPNPKSSKRKGLLPKIFASIPVWLIHLLSNRFLDSDLAFLHYQEQERQRRQNTNKKAFKKADKYFMPSASDRCIQALQKWVPRYASNLYPQPNNHGGSGLADKIDHDSQNKNTAMIPALSPQRLFDRYEQHTSNCVECRNALEKTFPRVRRYMYGVLSLSVAFFRFPLARVTTLLSLGVLRLLQKIENGMRKGGFKHYENH